ncbi:uncharacterized protein HKW66_Vig0004120 [Vigna angularis]|uniref:Uncharacterized protein n=1 Tax=Phaseolus angularis TaxID=3914 RepID=A0A8T0LCI6_PHAAN|nr:uncharacterized protein HKW66_Vig0004120 [Vigna angularis]
MVTLVDKIVIVMGQGGSSSHTESIAFKRRDNSPHTLMAVPVVALAKLVVAGVAHYPYVFTTQDFVDEIMSSYNVFSNDLANSIMVEYCSVNDRVNEEGAMEKLAERHLCDG